MAIKERKISINPLSNNIAGDDMGVIKCEKYKKILLKANRGKYEKNKIKMYRHIFPHINQHPVFKHSIIPGFLVISTVN